MGKPSLFLLCVTVFLLSACENKKAVQLQKVVDEKNKQIDQLEKQLAHAQTTTNSLLDRMSDLSIVNKEGAQSIRQSLENISQQYSFIENLTNKVQTKDSLNLSLVMNLKRSLSNINDDDVAIEVKGGIVNISISDKLLFRPGSARISSKAERVLGKVASIINDHSDLNVLVEGHTDDQPIKNKYLDDNWDLSVRRATSVVRKLQNDYYVSPERMTAAGRAEYVPKADNDTEEGRSKNRRTEILIMPRFDQFFELMETPELVN